MPLSTDDMRAFVQAYPGMTLIVGVGSDVVFEGTFEFEGSWASGPDVRDAYELRIEVPDYPAQLPRVFEIGNRIARDVDNHVFPKTGQLCLGSDLRLRLRIGRKLDLLKFADHYIVPYLYATSRRATEGCFVFGELAHGAPGLLDDYLDIFGLSTEDSLTATLRLLSIKRTSADKHPCPCGCGRRFALCGLRDRVNEVRQAAPRKYFEALYRARESRSETKA